MDEPGWLALYPAAIWAIQILKNLLIDLPIIFRKTNLIEWKFGRHRRISAFGITKHDGHEWEYTTWQFEFFLEVASIQQTAATRLRKSITDATPKASAAIFMFMAAKEAFMTAIVYSTNGLCGNAPMMARFRWASPITMTAF